MAVLKFPADRGAIITDRAATQGWSGIHPRQFDAPWRPQQRQQHLDALARLDALEHSNQAGEHRG